MTERDLPRGRGQVNGEVISPPVVPLSPEQHQARFDELSGAFCRGEFARRNEDGSVTNVVSYERYIDPLDKGDLALLREFRLRAAAAGLREAFSPLVLPTAGTVRPGEGVAVAFADAPHHPLTVVQLGYEKPARTAVAPSVPARRTYANLRFRNFRLPAACRSCSLDPLFLTRPGGVADDRAPAAAWTSVC